MFDGDIDAPIRGGLPWLAQDTQRLVDRLEELEALLGVGNDDVSRIRSALGITPQSAEIVGFMLKRAVASRDALYIMLFGDRPECDQPEMKIVDVQLCRARKALKRHDIEVRADWGLGSWSLSTAGKVKLRALMEAVN